MVGSTPETEEIILNFLIRFVSLPIDKHVCHLAVTLRKRHKIKLSDAIIWATSLVNNCILVTRNTKDFSQNELGILSFNR